MPLGARNLVLVEPESEPETEAKFCADTPCIFNAPDAGLDDLFGTAIVVFLAPEVVLFAWPFDEPILLSEVRARLAPDLEGEFTALTFILRPFFGAFSNVSGMSKLRSD